MESSDYRSGFNAGYERGANVETRNIRGAYERLTDDLAWALDQLEGDTTDPDTIERIARLRHQYGLRTTPS